MNPLSAIFRSGIRSLLLAVAVLSMLMGVGADLHLALSGSHDHQSDEPWVGLPVHGHDVAAGDAAADPEGCGECSCPTPSSDLPGCAPAIAGSGYAIVGRRPLDVLIPPGISFQPDPPPVRG